MGSIPVIQHSFLDPLFEDLPVVLINNWQEVTYDFLQKKYKELSEKTYNFEKLYANYWVQKIKEMQAFYKNQKGIS